MAHTITKSEAQAEINRRKNNKSGEYAPATNPAARLLSGKELAKIAGKSQAEKAVAQAAKVEVKVARKHSEQVTKQVLKARKAFDKAFKTEGLSAAYRAYRNVMVG